MAEGLVHRITRVEIIDDVIYGYMNIHLDDGEIIKAPFKWYTFMHSATRSERRDLRITGDGMLIHWPHHDVDVSIFSIMRHVRDAKAIYGHDIKKEENGDPYD